mmetsp:Transcript_30918/g.35505  ORF Transcript_30918/g.35505 Transcript_30918/m.35505 type:complete len:83 (+) Transcript_30918:3-251(+)
MMMMTMTMTKIRSSKIVDRSNDGISQMKKNDTSKNDGIGSTAVDEDTTNDAHRRKKNSLTIFMEGFFSVSSTVVVAVIIHRI